jgi:RNA polymerase sigma-70 factor (ECF subfamily)
VGPAGVAPDAKIEGGSDHPMSGSEDDGQGTELLRQARGGSLAARQQLLEQHRDRLHKMVSFRMDPRLRQRVNPSDVVQDTMIHAWNDLDAFLHDGRMPTYLWLRHLAWTRLIELYRMHVQAQKRSMNREGRARSPLSDDGTIQLADHLAGSASSPSARMIREEAQARVKDVLDRLPDNYREVLILRYLEELSVQEMAELLKTEEATIKKRHLRALQKMRELLGDDSRRAP